jgi:hypothetical protein
MPCILTPCITVEANMKLLCEWMNYGSFLLPPFRKMVTALLLCVEK